jgi:hypothetical protein
MRVLLSVGEERVLNVAEVIDIYYDSDIEGTNTHGLSLYNSEE